MRSKFKQLLLGNIVTLLLSSGAIQAAPAAEGYFAPSTIKQSFTHKNKAIKYRPGVLVIGAPRAKVLSAFGRPNSTDWTPLGAVEDVYVFTPEGFKYVNPHPRPRNIALGIVTMGTSVAVHQSVLAYQRAGLTIYRVYYNLNHKIIKVAVLRGSALKNPVRLQ
ncbi:MAG: hypothetical protein JSR33_11820 [Proteobacteria bacterium]|nr:hypothetical protein [Pseudomonadota bacterium]